MWVDVIYYYMCIYRGEATSYIVATTPETASEQENDLFERSASTLQYCWTRLYFKIIAERISARQKRMYVSVTLKNVN